MQLQHEDLDDFEPVIKNLYRIVFASERAGKTLVFPSPQTYLKNTLGDYADAQTRIAAEVIKTYEIKQQKEQEQKNLRRQSIPDKVAIKKLTALIKTLANRILVLRRLMDTIAFQLFDGQIWVAKRFIQHDKINGPDIPAIKENLEAANIWNKDNPPEFALVSDLTTFIEVGDLLVRQFRDGRIKWLIVELKTGKVNVELMDLIKSGNLLDTPTMNSLDDNTARQLKRILRQKGRTDQIVELVNTNKGTDIRTGMHLEIKEDNIQWKYFHKQLKDTAISANREKVSLCIIQKCFYIFASTLPDEQTARYFYRLIHPGSVYESEKSLDIQKEIENKKHREILFNPYVKDLFLHNLLARWRTPFFALPLDEVMFDLLFQRMRILLYLDIDGFFELCRSRGFLVEFISKSETNAIRSQAPATPLYNGQAIRLISKTGKIANIGDGLFNRLFFDLVSPSTLLDILIATAR